jgi:hypothetical protein
MTATSKLLVFLSIASMFFFGYMLTLSRLHASLSRLLSGHFKTDAYEVAKGCYEGVRFWARFHISLTCGGAFCFVVFLLWYFVPPIIIDSPSRLVVMGTTFAEGLSLTLLVAIVAMAVRLTLLVRRIKLWIDRAEIDEPSKSLVRDSLKYCQYILYSRPRSNSHSN